MTPAAAALQDTPDCLHGPPSPPSGTTSPRKWQPKNNSTLLEEWQRASPEGFEPDSSHLFGMCRRQCILGNGHGSLSSEHETQNLLGRAERQ